MKRSQPSLARGVIAAVVAIVCGAGCMPSGGSSSESIDGSGETTHEANVTWPIGHSSGPDASQMQRDMNEVDATRDK